MLFLSNASPPIPPPLPILSKGEDGKGCLAPPLLLDLLANRDRFASLRPHLRFSTGLVRVGALTSLDFLGLGVPPGTPSLGELLNQGKENLDAWWISLSTFGVLVVTLLLLILIGDALRDALDPRKVLEGESR